MKYFQLEGIINEELLNNFIHFCNENQEHQCAIIINSAGGKSTLARVIRSIINSRKDNTTLISAGSYSAAFWLFYFAECKKQIVYGSLGMYHMPHIKDIALNVNGKLRYYEDECQRENFRCENEKWIKDFMKVGEVRKFNKGDDVYFTYQRMKEIFPDAETL